MKPLREAKTRLSANLPPTEREALCLGLLRRVLRAAVESGAAQVWVVGGDAAVRADSARLGARWSDDGGSPLNDALSAAFLRAYASGLAPLYLPADLPFVGADDVAAVALAAGQGETLVMAAAHRDGGTNAILAPVGSPFRPSLGPDSLRRHVEQAAGLGLRVAMYDCPGLGLDLDTPADLRAYEEMQPGLLRRLVGTPGRGTGGPEPRTRTC